MSMTIAQAFAIWESEIKPNIPADDEPMLAESWNDYTDGLCKDRELGDLQYHYCPAWDDEMPDDDREFILESMGVDIDYRSAGSKREGWGAGASHWSVTITRTNHDTTNPFAYSMGSAHRGKTPDLCDVLSCALRDAEAAEQDFDDWAKELGYDTDSRKAYAMWEECKVMADRLGSLFTTSELEGLRELFSDY